MINPSFDSFALLYDIPLSAFIRLGHKVEETTTRKADPIGRGLRTRQCFLIVGIAIPPQAGDSTRFKSTDEKQRRHVADRLSVYRRAAHAVYSKTINADSLPLLIASMGKQRRLVLKC
jgi:hypothetical protein